MKRLIFTIIPLAVGLFVAAQTEEADSTVVSQKSTSTNEAKAENLKVIGNNRNIIHLNGQKATPSGHQATGVGSGYAALGKETENSSSNKYNDPGAHGTHGIPVIGNNRAILHWNNGQRSTTTGHQAAAMGAGYAALGKTTEKNYSDKFNDPGAHGTHGIPVVGNNRLILHWSNGQSATPTGHQAAAMGGGYAALGNYQNKFIARDSGDDDKNVVNDSNVGPREIYKKNGQKATRTGHEATGMGSGYSFSKKDK